MCRIRESTKNISPRRIKAKTKIRFKCNSHGLRRAVHARERRKIRWGETASIRDAESGRNPFLFLEREKLGKRRKSAALKVNLESGR